MQEQERETLIRDLDAAGLAAASQTVGGYEWLQTSRGNVCLLSDNTGSCDYEEDQRHTQALYQVENQATGGIYFVCRDHVVWALQRTAQQQEE